jgi:hypothetical protein
MVPVMEAGDEVMVPHRLDAVGGERESATLVSRHLRPGSTDLQGDQAPSTEMWRVRLEDGSERDVPAEAITPGE